MHACMEWNHSCMCMHALWLHVIIIMENTPYIFPIVRKDDRFVPELFEHQASPEYIVHDAKEKAFDDTGQYFFLVNSAGV